MTEAEFQAQVVELAAMTGWRAMHVRRSMGRRGGAAAWQTTTSIKGWPDLFLFNPRLCEVVAVELKSDDGVLSPEQRDVLADLEASGVPTEVWRPRDWDRLEAVLTGKVSA